ncbi:MAG: hypothetical protein EPO02_09720, partial [Nitrospirae bacterium]
NDGLHPRHLEEVIGAKLKHSLKEGQALTWEAFQKRG